MLDDRAPANAPVVRLVATGLRYSTDVLHSAFGANGPALAVASGRVTQPASSSPEPDEAAVMSAADHLRANEPYLWQGYWETAQDPLSGKKRFPSQSEADHYLAREIARLGATRGLVGRRLEAFTEAVFDQSGLAQRHKWQQREDYRKRTVTRACAALASVAMQANPVGAATAAPNWKLKGDVRAAQYARDLFRRRLIFVRSIEKWLLWHQDGQRWHWCELGEETAMVTQAMVQLYRLACAQAQGMDAEAGKRLITEVTPLQTAYRINAVVELLKSIEGMSIKPGNLDNHPTLLGVNNGVVDLASGKLLPNRPGLFITRHLAVDFDPIATAPRWELLLPELFKGDQATVDAVHRLVGMTAVGKSDDELMIFCVGTGANGKSIFSNTLARVLGPYATTAPSSVLAARRSEDHGARPDIAMLAGSRLVSINELPGGMTLDETVVKQLAGREPISARFLYAGFFTFAPMFSVWVRTNHKPIIKGTDNGIWRRIVILPFRRTFTPGEQDPKLEAKLTVEQKGILAWIVRGAMTYLKSGITISPAMKAEAAQYRVDSDILGEFLADNTVPDEKGRELQSKLFARWSMWCESNGHRCPSKRTFTARLEERGFGQSKSGRDRFYVGLRLQDHPLL